MLESHSPATGELLGSVTTLAARNVEAVVGQVAAVQRFWSGLGPEDRGRYLRRAAQAILDELDELAELIAREQGRPLVETLTMELLPGVALLHRAARARHVSESRGVVGVAGGPATPFSAPLGELACALMEGNGVVFVPAPSVCLVGERIGRLFQRAGLPDGLLRVIHGDDAVGGALARASVTTAREPGGKAPLVVLEDASLSRAVRGALWGAFTNAGQGPAAIERVYVARELHERFSARLVAGAGRLRVGDPLQWSTEIGPLGSRDQLERVRELVDAAVAAGASLRCGGPIAVPGLPGPFYAPAVLSGAEAELRIMREPIPGPVLSIVAIDSDEHALRLAADREHGLGASIWTRERARSARWYPYDESLGRAFAAGARILYGRDADRAKALRAGAQPMLRLARRLAHDGLRDH